MSRRFLSQFALIASLVLSPLAFANGIELTNPAVRAMPPGAPASGAYVTLTNHSDTERLLVGVESNVAKSVEIHLSQMKGETMVMERVDSIAVPAHGQAILKPGSFHIMMIGLERPLKAGDTVDFVLVMADGERIPMQAPILSPEDMAAYAPGGMPMSHMQHDHMKQDASEGEHKHH